MAQDSRFVSTGGIVETLRAMPRPSRRMAIADLMKTGDADARRAAALAANDNPRADDAPANKSQTPIMTKTK